MDNDSDFTLKVFLGDDGIPNLYIDAGRHLTPQDDDFDLPADVRRAIIQLVHALYNEAPYIVIIHGAPWFARAEDQRPA